jgi:hypothetical protein
VGVDEVFNQYGAGQATAFIQSVMQRPLEAFAVWMNRATADGPGADPYAAVNARVAEIRAVTSKPIWCFVDRLTPADTGRFNCDRRIPAYLPYAGSSYYGSEDRYQEVGTTARTVDGSNAWAALQGFSWWDDEPQTAARLGFPRQFSNGQRIGAPPVATVQQHAQMLLNSGVTNLVVITEGGTANDLAYLGNLGQAVRALL